MKIKHLLLVSIALFSTLSYADNGPWTQPKCLVDDFTDVRSCFFAGFFATRSGGSMSNLVRVQIDNGTRTGIILGYHTHPGAIGRVRIDKHEAILFDSSLIRGPDADAIISQMRGGSKGRAQTVTWPSKYVTFEFTLEGFNDTYIELLKLSEQ